MSSLHTSPLPDSVSQNGSTVAGPNRSVRGPRARRAMVLLALLGAIAMVGVSCTKNAAAYESADRINTERSGRGLRQLSLDATLVNKAQAWAERMAATRNVSHSVLTDNAGKDWRVLGENVGWARSVAEMHALFMNSAAHRANIVNGRFSRVGTGVAVVDGQYYVVQVFAG